MIACLDDVPENLCYWGKASGEGWHPLLHHSLDVAATGRVLLDRLPAVEHLFVQRLGFGGVALRDWISFWLAVHDLGKFAEAFQAQRPDLFQALRRREANPAKPYVERHDSLGMLFWDEVVTARMIDGAWFGPATEDLADGLGAWMRASTGHHGQPPRGGSFWKDHFHPRHDKDAALAHVEDMRATFLGRELVDAIAAYDPGRFLAVSQELSWWMAGVAVLADWLGSNTTFFPYLNVATDPLPAVEEYWCRATEQAHRAFEASGVLPPESTKPLRFGALFPELGAPSPLQRWASDATLAEGPQIHCLEDVTGAGKTEAALMLVHRLMSSEQATGFFVALPTMASANAMYARVASAYRRLFEDAASLVLATSGRGLVDDFMATVVEDLGAGVLPFTPIESDTAQSDESASARCAAWLADHHKRSLLSPAGVGTIDQALLAVLHSKHQSLRLLGLCNKVLVVDEVHACDEYMLEILARLLEFHARGGGSAVLLSATLPIRARQRLLTAFARGREARIRQVTSFAYPLVTSWPSPILGTDIPRESGIATRPDVQRTVEIALREHVDDVLALIRRALAAGQCVCWVRNTVADAIDAFSRWEGELTPDRLWLFHARFALHDRLTMEAQVLEAFGKSGGPAQRGGRLLIATQVAEQSLDVDFDVLVTDLAPVDRLVQRAGRLRRHRRNVDGSLQSDSSAPDARGTPVLHVLCPKWNEAPGVDWYKAMFPKAAAVYQNHAQLWLTMKWLRTGAFTMPDDARTLIEGVFGEDVEVPAGLEANALAMEGQDFAARTQAMMSTLSLNEGYTRNQSGGVDWWGDAHTPSRLGEATSSVTLARWDGRRLRPWVDRQHGWAYSSLRVAERAIAAAAPVEDAALQAALDEVREHLPAKGRWTVLLPLRETPDGWIGDAMAPATRYRPATRRSWRYDPRRGLEAWLPGQAGLDNSSEDSEP